MNAFSLLKKSLLYSALPMVLIGLILSSYYAKALEEERASVEARERVKHSIIQHEISEDLQGIVNDLHLLATHFELEGFLNSEHERLSGLEREFLAFSALKPIFSQVRLLDQRGRERIRINALEGHAEAVSKDALQNKGNRYYVKEVQKLGPGEVYFSPLDLNIEQNKIEQPPRPSFRVGTALFDRGGERKGMLILNLSGFFLLKHPESHFTKEIAQSLFVDAGAFYFHRPAGAIDWTFIHKNQDTFFSEKTLDAGLWAEIRAQTSGQFTTEKGLLIFTSIFPQALSGAQNEQAPGHISGPRWTFVSVVPEAFFERSAKTLLKQLSGLFCFLTLVVGGSAAVLIQTAFRRRLSEEKLKKSEARYRQLLETTGYGIEEIDASGTIIFANEAYHKMLGYAPGALLGRKLWEMLPPKFRDRAKPCMMSSLALGRSAQLEEVQVIRKDGRIIDIEVARSTRLGKEGEALGFISVVSDISQRKEAEKQVEKALSEKEMLLREVHHRVKNNLQMVRSLLYLQAKSVEGERDRQRFQEAQERVQTMALIHEQLYRSENISRVHFGEYIYNLVKELKKSYNVDEEQIKVVLDLEPISLSLDLAIPCGLIVNELLTNMMKHAFPDGRQGLIGIACRIADGGRILLEVRDNGIGLPEGFDLKTSNRLGLHLVLLLVDQIEGEISLEHSEGTRFRIFFEGEINQ